MRIAIGPVRDDKNYSLLHMLVDCPGLKQRRLKCLVRRFFDKLDSIRDVPLQCNFEDVGMILGFPSGASC